MNGTARRGWELASIPRSLSLESLEQSLSRRSAFKKKRSSEEILVETVLAAILSSVGEEEKKKWQKKQEKFSNFPAIRGDLIGAETGPFQARARGRLPSRTSPAGEITCNRAPTHRARANSPLPDLRSIGKFFEKNFGRIWPHVPGPGAT